MQLQDLLSSLDVSTEEIELYLLLLQYGPITVGDLAKHMGAPRPTLYGFLERLKEKGIVSESQKFHVKQFIAAPPEQITLLFEQRIAELERNKASYISLLPELEAHVAASWIKPKFQVYEGADGLRHLMKDALLYKDVETQSLWPIKAMIEILSPDFFRYLNQRRIKNRMYTRAIWPENQAVDIKQHPYLGVGKEFMREIRIAPAKLDFSMGYWVYGNKAAFISSRKENFGFLVESPELRQMLKTQFDLLWDMSKPVQVDFADTRGFLEESGLI